MTRFLTRLVLIALIVGFVFPAPQLFAQDASTRYKDPTYRFTEEDYDPDITQYDVSTLSAEDQIIAGLSASTDTLNGLNQAFGVINGDGQYRPGSLRNLKLKPSDKKRLIQIANGSLTERQKKSIFYDSRLMNLLVKLTSPREAGGGGLTYLKVGDLLRFRSDPRSKETENTDNISQHTYGKAADILEINKTRCVASSFFGGDEKLPPFPVKVAWQGGGPYDPSAEGRGSFDANLRNQAFRDILGTLPGDTYNGSIQGFNDVLQQTQRRVIANDLGLDPASLDYLVNNDVLETLGRVIVNKNLGFPQSPTALSGNNKTEVLRSIPQAFMEQSLNLPPGSFKGDLNDAIERLGRYKVALDVGADPADIIAGKVDEVRNSPYYQTYKETENAYRLVSGTLDKLKNNDADAYRQVGAILIADRLHYAPGERQQLINQASSKQVTQLNLGHIGDLKDFPGSAILMLAPGNESSKTKGEDYIAKVLLGANGDATLDQLEESIRTVLSAQMPILSAANTKGDVINFFENNNSDKSRTAFREIGAKYMEEAFDLPTNSFATTFINAKGSPSFDQFINRLGQRVLEEYAGAGENGFQNAIALNGLDVSKADYNLSLPAGTIKQFTDRKLNANELKKLVGQAYLRDMFSERYMVPEVGMASISFNDMFSILLGQVNDAATRAGASWVEEDLGLTPGSFASIFSGAEDADRMSYAGLSVVAGELFEVFDINLNELTSVDAITQATGAARIETVVGLTPGSWRESLAVVKSKNPDRFDTIFSSPTDIDAILGITSGATKQFLDGKLAPNDLAAQVGKPLFDKLNTDTLENKFGWDSRFKVDGTKILAAINKGDITETKQQLAKIGGFNLDFAFGYDSGTMRDWNQADNADARNRIIVRQGGKLYADRMGFDLNQRNDWVESYLTGNGSARQATINKIRSALEKPASTVTSEDFARSTRNEIDKSIGQLEESLDTFEESTGLGMGDAREQLNRVKNKLDDLSQTKYDQGRYDEVSRDLESVLSKVPTSSDETRDVLDQIVQGAKDRIATERGKLERSIPGATISIPQSDVLSFVNGDMTTAVAVITAATMAKQTTTDIGEAYNDATKKYELFRIIAGGWGPNDKLEDVLSKDAIESYKGKLEDYAATKADAILDQAFEHITKGVLNRDGTFNPGITPYNGSYVDLVKNTYFASSEARNDYFYGVLDSTIRKQDPSIPANFSETLLNGSNGERSSLILTYLEGKLGDNITATLPSDLQPIVRSFLTNFNADTGKILENNAIFTTWASATMSKYIGSTLPPSAYKMAIEYVTGTFDPKVLAAGEGVDASVATDNRAGFEALLQSTVGTAWIEKTMDLPVGEFQEYYNTYKEVQSAYKDFQAGNLDATQAVVLADELIFGGAISGFIGSIDETLGLPAGSTQSLISFAVTGNPIYLASFVFGLFFGTTIECPDLQLEAQKNVKLLLRETLNLGHDSAGMIPSQIIVYDPSYLRQLANKIKYNYAVCQEVEDARCGVFARPEYSKQVHIGF